MSFNFGKLTHLLILILLSVSVAFADIKTVEIDGAVFNFSQIPGGKFTMGDSSGQKDEQPIRNVEVSLFYLQTTEVTLEQYSKYAATSKFSDIKGCWYFNNEWLYSKEFSWRNPGYEQDDNHPVVCISWLDVQDFISWLNSKSHHNFRLPTEAEWEYAARAFSTTTYYWGDDPKTLCVHSNAADNQTLQKFPTFRTNDCDDGYLATSPVGYYLPNPFGLYDIYGNAWEWTQDCWNASYEHAPDDGTAWLEGECNKRVYRGGGWGDTPRFARSSLRNVANKNERRDDVGFRLVLEPKFE